MDATDAFGFIGHRVASLRRHEAIEMVARALRLERLGASARDVPPP
jgi:hypothetical protein